MGTSEHHGVRGQSDCRRLTSISHAGRPAHFIELATIEVLTSVLRELGDLETRLAVRAQLINRPLSTGSFPDHSRASLEYAGDHNESAAGT